MYSNSHTEWLSKVSLMQEQFGQKPKYPLTSLQLHIKNEIQNQNDIIKHASKELSNEIVNGIEKAVSQISGDLQTGFNYLGDINSKGFNDVTNEIKDLTSTMSWYFSEVIEQAKTSNLLLENIAVLLRIPDIQKERQYYIEQGLKFFVNAKSDKSLYDDAIENFLKAEKIEKTDYFLLQKIGLIYLFSKKHKNINKAIEYFNKSIKYSSAELNENSIQTNNPLNNTVSNHLSEQNNSTINIRNITAYSYLYLARCHYIKKDYDYAYSYADSANNLVNDMIEAKYDIAKYLIKKDEINKALIIIKKIVQKNRFITLKIENDYDFITKKDIQIYIDTITNKAVQDAKELINKVKSFNCSDNKIVEIINSATRNYNTKTFLGAKEAINIIEKKYEWKYRYLHFPNNDENIYFDKIKLNIKKLFEYKEIKNAITSMDQLNKNKMTQLIKKVIGFPSIKSYHKESNVFEFINSEKKYFYQKKEFDNINNIIGKNLDLLIKKERKKRDDNSTILSLIAIPIGIVYGAVFGFVFGIALGIFTGFIGLFFGAGGDVFSATIIIATIIGSIGAAIFLFINLREIKSSENVFVQIFHLLTMYIFKNTD